VIKHRQLARHVGAFGDLVIESSMDLDVNMKFPAGLVITFGSWVYKADEDGLLHDQLKDMIEDQGTSNPPRGKVDQLA